jgi:tetratricopeptide (TPR) repeat protein
MKANLNDSKANLNLSRRLSESMSLLARVRFKWKPVVALAFATILALAASAARAQDPNKPPPPPPQPPAQAPPPSSGESSSRAPADGLAAVPPPPTGSGLPGDPEPLAAFNPLEAQKDVEVGNFYMKQGKYDAAIDRYIDATKAQPSYAAPWQLMGEAYEKKGDLDESIKSYQKYLKLYPHAPDRKKLEDHIAELQKKEQQAAQKRAGK